VGDLGAVTDAHVEEDPGQGRRALHPAEDVSAEEIHGLGDRVVDSIQRRAARHLDVPLDGRRGGERGGGRRRHHGAPWLEGRRGRGRRRHVLLDPALVDAHFLERGAQGAACESQERRVVVAAEGPEIQGFRAQAETNPVGFQGQRLRRGRGLLGFGRVWTARHRRAGFRDEDRDPREHHGDADEESARGSAATFARRAAFLSGQGFRSDFGGRSRRRSPVEF
jgi:hypothetical protein